MTVKYVNIVGKKIDRQTFSIIDTLFPAIETVDSLKYYSVIKYDEKGNTINPNNHSFKLSKIDNKTVELSYIKKQ